MSQILSPPLIAHRGFSADAPENTLASIKAAIGLKTEGIEIDVRLSKDGVPIVIHDSSTARTTNDPHGRRIEDLELKELQALDAGSWFNKSYTGEGIPTLEEVLSLDRGSSILMIELKKGNYAPEMIVEKTLSVLNRSGELTDPSRIVIGSIALELVEELQKQAPGLPIIGIIESYRMAEEYQRLGIKTLAFWYKLITPSIVHTLHGENRQIWAFTVDDPNEGRFLASIQVDAIITNNPQKLKQSLLP